MRRGNTSIDPLLAVLRGELDATARASRTTLPSRAAIALVGLVLLAMAVGLPWAIGWLIGLGALELALHRLSALCPHEGMAAKFGAVIFVVLLGLISLAWATTPIVFWNTGRPVLEFAGMAILVAQLIDVQCYTFRMRYTPILLGGAPLVLLMILPLRSSFLNHDQISERVILGFCLACAAAYSITAVRQNRKAAEQLSESKVAAQAASLAKSAFVAMISHEMRTPMNGVLGLAHALKLSTATSATEREGQIDQIIRSGESLMALLDDILDLAKVEAGKMDIHPHPFEVRAFSDELAKLWGPLAQAKGLSFACRFEPDQSQWLFGDAARLRQILGNLISNAIKFTAADDVSCLLQTREDGEHSALLQVQVIDSGIGMNAAQQASLFRPFTQASESIGRDYGGTGLGLSISRGLVEAMGGSLCATSEPGQGSTFKLQISLPRTDPMAAPTATATAATAATPGLERLRVLVVDDNPVNLWVATALLDALGASSTTAAGGAAALTCLRNARFDVVLMDVHMPVMGGIEALQRIRRGEGGPADIRVVAFTADAMDEEVTRLHALGFDSVLAKPITPQHLAATLSDVPNGAPMGRSEPRNIHGRPPSSGAVPATELVQAP